jgi:hypothetical protein
MRVIVITIITSFFCYAAIKGAEIKRESMIKLTD